LTISFINQWKVYNTRKQNNPEIFYAKTYTKNEDKMWVNDGFMERCNKFIWNPNIDSPILPVFHGIFLLLSHTNNYFSLLYDCYYYLILIHLGTDLFIAEKIAQTGFCALSSI
jgi:hypothetical protein